MLRKLLKHLFFLFFLIVFTSTKAQVNGIDFYQNILTEITAQKGTLYGHIYKDVNGNGVEDPGEPGIENVSVIFVDSNGNGQTVETNADGDWTVDDIIYGYRLKSGPLQIKSKTDGD